MDSNNTTAVLTEHGIQISGDSSDPLVQRLRQKLSAEVQAFEQEQKQRQAQCDKYSAIARMERDHIAVSPTRTRTSGLKPDQLSEAALQDVSKKLMTVDDTELRRIFGKSSDSRYAAKIGTENPLLYRTLRQLARDRGIL